MGGDRGGTGKIISGGSSLKISLGKTVQRGLRYFGLRISNVIIPKKADQILFSSIPDYFDNTKTLYEYAVTNKMNHCYCIVWLVHSPEVLQALTQRRVEIYLEKGIHGLYSIFRLKYIIAIHNPCCGIKAKNQLSIDLCRRTPLYYKWERDSINNLINHYYDR